MLSLPAKMWNGEQIVESIDSINRHFIQIFWKSKITSLYALLSALVRTMRYAHATKILVRVIIAFQSFLICKISMLSIILKVQTRKFPHNARHDIRWLSTSTTFGAHNISFLLLTVCVCFLSLYICDMWVKCVCVCVCFLNLRIYWHRKKWGKHKHAMDVLRIWKHGHQPESKTMSMSRGMGLQWQRWANKMNAILIYVRISWLPVTVAVTVLILITRGSKKKKKNKTGVEERKRNSQNIKKRRYCL